MKPRLSVPVNCGECRQPNVYKNTVVQISRKKDQPGFSRCAVYVAVWKTYSSVFQYFPVNHAEVTPPTQRNHRAFRRVVSATLHQLLLYRLTSKGLTGQSHM